MEPLFRVRSERRSLLRADSPQLKWPPPVWGGGTAHVWNEQRRKRDVLDRLRQLP